MRRLLIATATAAALLFPAVASAWEGVQVEVTFPERVTAGRVSVIDFHVFVGGKPLDLSTVGPRMPGLRPIVVFLRGKRQVTVTAWPTSRSGVYRVRVVLPAIGGWSYSFHYAGLERTFPRVVARG
jgi:hypothetical protein